MTVNLIMNVAAVLLGAAAVVMSDREEHALFSISLAFLCGLVTSTASRMNIAIEEEQHGHIDPD